MTDDEIVTSICKSIAVFTSELNEVQYILGGYTSGDARKYPGKDLKADLLLGQIRTTGIASQLDKFISVFGMAAMAHDAERNQDVGNGMESHGFL